MYGGFFTPDVRCRGKEGIPYPFYLFIFSSKEISCRQNCQLIPLLLRTPACSAEPSVHVYKGKFTQRFFLRPDNAWKNGLIEYEGKKHVSVHMRCILYMCVWKKRGIRRRNMSYLEAFSACIKRGKSTCKKDDKRRRVNIP